ncbi:MAG TPA: penicillin-binding protein 2 [Thermoanaerobaculia bacterium]|nr:penicillin-binding protein 2 [Thermoanaerobaculia bacterium]
MRRRLLLVVAIGAAWTVLIGARFYQLQVVRYDHYAGKAERQQQRVVTLDPPRGTIYDAKGRELAVSVQVDSAYAVPPEIDDPEEVARALAKVVPELDAAKLVRQLSRDREFIWVARKLDPPVAAAVRKLDLPGIYFLPESKRYYPMRELAAQVLGYVGTDNQGLAGLEALYDDVIAGKPGKRTVLRDARHRTVVSPELSLAEPEPGQDLHLTLDAAVQHIVERELAKAVLERGATRGMAVFLDPWTGGVVAMASYPGFDPNRFNDFPASRRRNRAIMDIYEPGSTFKIITAAAALESGLVKADDVFDCEMGGVVVFGKRIRDHKPFGRLTFAEVLAKSSNVGVIKTALILGDERIEKTVRGFGFGTPTGIDLPGEESGIVHSLKHPRQKAYVSFGQGISVTALQLTAAIAAVANEGTLLKPHVVAAVGRAKKYPQPPVVGRPMAPEAARELRRLLEGVVTGGTGKAAGVPGYHVAGKTGTAQIPVAGGYSHSGYLPSFVGFAPAGRPVIVGLVAVAEPKGFAYHGGQVAAPVFGAVARQVLLYLGVRPERDPLVRWPGQILIASLPEPAPPTTPEPDEILSDGDDVVIEDVPGPSSTAPAAGGRSHAPF